MNRSSTRSSRLSAFAAIVAVSAGLSLFGVAAPASAQSRGKATINFAFTAGKVALPAGVYNIEAADGRITLTAQDHKVPTVMLPVITRLGRHDADKFVEVVFDKTGDKLSLAEIWLDGRDGYLVLSTSTAHEHRVVAESAPVK